MDIAEHLAFARDFMAAAAAHAEELQAFLYDLQAGDAALPPGRRRPTAARSAMSTTEITLQSTKAANLG